MNIRMDIVKDRLDGLNMFELRSDNFRAGYFTFNVWLEIKTKSDTNCMEKIKNHYLWLLQVLSEHGLVINDSAGMCFLESNKSCLTLQFDSENTLPVLLNEKNNDFKFIVPPEDYAYTKLKIFKEINKKLDIALHTLKIFEQFGDVKISGTIMPIELDTCEENMDYMQFCEPDEYNLDFKMNLF